MELTNCTANELGKLLASGQASSRDIVTAYLSQIHSYNPTLNAFISWDAEGALAAAGEADRRRASGGPLSAWDGVPVVVKDIICTRQLATTCGSRSLETFLAPYQATVIDRMEHAGLIVMGKTNLDEFAMGGSTETSIFGAAHNPWDLQRTAGGSSGGSAVAVAARMAPWALGTDTGGSIRLPAAYCGICGMKPTYGRISRYGQVAYASSLDQLGPMAQTVEDTATLLAIISGHCVKDSTSLQLPSITGFQPSQDHQAEISKLRLGVVREQFEDPGLDPEVRGALQTSLDRWQHLGAKIEWLSMPTLRHGISAYYVIASCEASSNLSRYDGVRYGYRAGSESMPHENASTLSPLNRMYAASRSHGFGEEVKRRLMLGTFALSAGYFDAYYKKALQVRRLISQEYQRAFAKVDVIVGPTAPSTAFRLGEKQDDPVQMYLVDLYTVGANLAGLPAMSIPMGMSSTGLPLGLQLQAAPLADLGLLQIASAFHREWNYQPLRPTLSRGIA